MTAPRRLARGLRWRVVAGMVAAALTALLLLAAVSSVVARRELVANARRAAVEESRAAVTLLERALPSPTLGAVDDLTAELREIGDFELVARVDGAVLRTDERVTIDQVPPELRSPSATTRVAAVEAAEEPWLITATRADNGVELFLFFSRRTLDRNVTTLTRVIVMAALGTAVVMIGGTILASRRLFRPVDHTAAAARQLAAGVLGARAPERPGSFTDLTDAFNEMAAALERTIERLREMEARQRRFVADVSHELRTPLTALTTAADLVEPAVAGLSGSQRRAAELLVGEVRGLRQMVDDLMEISRLDEGVEVASEPVSVARVLGSMVEQHGWADVRVEGDGNVIAQADPRRLHAVFRNLIENALVHGGPPVRVTVSTAGRQVVVEVVDSGPGIPDGLREQVFDRFYKAGPARTRTGGSGLGLSIARENARLMGGDVTLAEPGRGGGARFVVSLLQAMDAEDTVL